MVGKECVVRDAAHGDDELAEVVACLCVRPWLIGVVLAEEGVEEVFVVRCEECLVVLAVGRDDVVARFAGDAQAEGGHDCFAEHGMECVPVAVADGFWVRAGPCEVLVDQMREEFVVEFFSVEPVIVGSRDVVGVESCVERVVVFFDDVEESLLCLVGCFGVGRDGLEEWASGALEFGVGGDGGGVFGRVVVGDDAFDAGHAQECRFEPVFASDVDVGIVERGASLPGG